MLKMLKNFQQEHTFLKLYPIDGAVMAPLVWAVLSHQHVQCTLRWSCDGSMYKLVTRWAVRASDLPLSINLKAWSDSSVGRALDIQCQALRPRIPHFHSSSLQNPVASTQCRKGFTNVLRDEPKYYRSALEASSAINPKSIAALSANFL